MTQLTESQVKEVLYKENNDFRELKDQHAHFDTQLQQLMKKGKLSAEDELSIANIKKQKLLLKDRMYSMIRDYIIQKQV